jgi:hypothetical protein
VGSKFGIGSSRTPRGGGVAPIAALDRVVRADARFARRAFEDELASPTIDLATPALRDGASRRMGCYDRGAMAARRHLPVLQSKPVPASEEPRVDDEPGPASDDTPAWHWVPLGMLATVLVSAVLARVIWVPFAARIVEGLGPSPARAALDAAQLRLALVGALVGVLGTLIGGVVVGAFGNSKVNQRHGLLAGGGAMALVGLLSGARMGAGGAVSAALMIPIGAMAGYVGAVLGLRAKFAIVARRRP